MRWQLVFAAVVAALAAGPAAAQTLPPERSLESLKQETMARITATPPQIEGILPEDARVALCSLTSMDRDEWAAAWMAPADRYMAEANALKANQDPAAEALFLRAYRYYKLAHYPTDNSSKKKEAYRKGIAAFLAYASTLSPPLEVMRIPFEGGEIVGYLRLPARVRPAPVVILSGGIDGRKEDEAARSNLLIEQGIGIFATDMPGTGEAPIKATPTADRLYSAVLDALGKRADVDAKRIAFHGSSWSGYWAAKLAIVERQRLKAVVAQGLPIHAYFQREWQEKALGTREYLMDLFAARSAVYGTDTLAGFLDYGPKMSLEALGLLDKPSAPMLLVNGEKDSQVPIDDLYLLMRHGSPKEAWVNPEGGHMGKGKGWPTPRIRAEVVAPWLVRQLNGDPVAARLAKADAEPVHASAGSSTPPHPADVYPESGFRLPLLKRDALDAAGQTSYDHQVDPKNGSVAGLRGPGGIKLYNGELALIAEPLNRYLRYRAGLSPHVREVAILTTARAFDSQFEWAAHEREAIKAGVPAGLIDAIRYRKSTDGLAEPDAVIIDLGREAFATKRVSSQTFARALKQFGPKDLLTIVTLMGYYSGSAVLLATFDMQLPPGVAPGLPVP